MNHEEDTTTRAPSVSDVPLSPDAWSISLQGELDVIRDAIEGARMVSDLNRHEQTTDEMDRLLAPRACSAMLCLVSCRLSLVIKISTKQQPPQHLAARHNLVIDEGDDATSEDILIPLESAEES